jgi:hypothetical protein
VRQIEVSGIADIREAQKGPPMSGLFITSCYIFLFFFVEFPRSVR